MNNNERELLIEWLDEVEWEWDKEERCLVYYTSDFTWNQKYYGETLSECAYKAMKEHPHDHTIR